MLLKFGDNLSDSQALVEEIYIGLRGKVLAKGKSGEQAGNLRSDGRIVSSALKLEKGIGPASVILREGFLLAHVDASEIYLSEGALGVVDSGMHAKHLEVQGSAIADDDLVDYFLGLGHGISEDFPSYLTVYCVTVVFEDCVLGVVFVELLVKFMALGNLPFEVVVSFVHRSKITPCSEG